MIALIAASAMYMVAGQASIAAPTGAFRDCLKQTSAKAKNEKVPATAYEAYARTACGAQLSALRSALIAFNVKNGMSRKDSASDADLIADDYLASSVDNYTFLAGVAAENSKAEAAAKAPAAPAATSTAQPTPASAPQPPK